MEASISHDIETLRELTAENAVWKLGPFVFEGREEVLKPNAWDAGTDAILEYRNVRVKADTVEFELLEHNEILRAVGLEVVHHYTRFVFENGKMILKEPWQPRRPAIGEFNKLMEPLRSWIREAHPEALEVLFDEEGVFEFSREGGTLMVELAREWVEAGRPDRQ